MAEKLLGYVLCRQIPCKPLSPSPSALAMTLTLTQRANPLIKARINSGSVLARPWASHCAKFGAEGSHRLTPHRGTEEGCRRSRVSMRVSVGCCLLQAVLSSAKFRALVIFFKCQQLRSENDGRPHPAWRSWGITGNVGLITLWPEKNTQQDLQQISRHNEGEQDRHFK